MVCHLFGVKPLPVPILTSQIAKFMGSTWGPPGSCRPQMGPMMAPWTLLSGLLSTGPLGTTSSEIWIEIQGQSYRCRYSILQWCHMSIMVSQITSYSHSLCFFNTLIARFMGPTSGPSGADRTQVGPMNFAIWASLFFRLTSKKHERSVSLTLCEGNPPLSGLSSQRASNTENVSISRYHYKSEFGDFRNSKYVSQTKDTYRLYHCPIHFYSLRLSTNKSAFSYHWLRKVPLVIHLGTYPFTC